MKLSLSTTLLGLFFAGTSHAFTPSTTALPVQRRLQSSKTELYERKPFITGNWKLNPSTKGEAIQLATEIAKSVTPDSPDVGLFVPFPFIETVQLTVGDKITVGAEVSFVPIC